ncbi:MAG: leucine-rich repeat protein [Prevotella sp.]|nr:leucine-rich repeat protein [Prevotella sp.]
MIRFLLKRTKFHRTALILLAMVLTTTTAWAETETVTFIGANGELQTIEDYTVLTEYYADATLGSDGEETWYYVDNKLNFENYSLNIEGTVNIILGDNADLIVDYISSGSNTTLNIYGTGKLTLYTDNSQCIDCNNLNIYGGKINVYNISTVYPAITVRNVNIYGGKVSVTGCGILADVINLGWTLPDDFIEVSNYDGNITVRPGKELYYNGNNGTEKYSPSDQITNDDIKGKKLQPVVASIAIDGSNETIYSCLTEEESVYNSNDHDVKIKMLTDANFYGSQIVFDNNNSETESETTHNAKITLDLNGHTLTGKLTIKARDPNGQPILVNYSIISVKKKANVEITDLSEGKGGTFNAIYCIASSGTLSVSNVSFISKNDTKNIISNSGTLSVNNVSFDLDKDSKSCIYNSGTLSVSNTKLYCENADANNVTHGIYTDENSTLNIGSGVSFSGLIYGIYTNYTEEQGPWRARAMTRGNETEKEPAKLYINALPVFENCMYDIYLNRSIMDFSNATAPLALASGQERITFKDYNFAPLIVFTKDYTQAFTNPTTGVITNPNDIFKYFDGEYYGETYYAFGEAIFSTSAFKLSVVTSDASGAISDLLGYSKASPDYSNSNLIAALNSLENGGTVQLFSDITGATEPYVINKGTAEAPVTLDLNGHTITGDMTIESGSTLILTDSSNGNGHIKGAVTVPLDGLQNRLANWGEKADTIKSTGKIKTEFVNNLTWTLTKADGDKIDGNFPLKLIIEGNGTMGSFSLHGAPWYAVHSYITEASLPEGLDQIGVYAFLDCAITSITIPASVSSIDYAFYDCKKLANVTFKGNITEIGSNAFNGCSALKEITLPNSVTKFGNCAFCNSGLTRITIPGSVSKICMGAFSNCKNLAKVTLSEGLEEIDWAFDGCTSLTEISIPSSVTSIGQNSFYGCTSLKTVRINSTKATCHHLAFSGCDALERIIVPNGATIAKYLEDEYFNYYNGDKICAEGYCGVSSENEGKNVIWTVMPTGEKDENIPLYALNISVNPDVENQTNFDMMTAEWRNPDVDPWNGVRDSISEINIGEGVTSIAGNAFYSLNKIKYVIIPNSVKTIAGNAFSDCSNLKWIIVNNVDKFMNAEGWDDAMKTKLRSSKSTLFAEGATNEWMTWCSDIEYTKPEGCTVYTVSNVTNDVVNLKLWEGNNLPAFVPVLIKREAGQLSADIKAEFKDVSAEPEYDNASTDGTDYTEIYINNYNNQQTIISSFNANNHNNWGTIYANSGAVLNPNNTGWVWNNDEASTYVLYGDKFLKVDTDEGIPTNHWILRIRFKESVYATRSLSIGYGDEDTTSIDEVRCQMADGEWYDLQGRRLDSKPTQKGLYINNGKKIVIK